MTQNIERRIDLILGQLIEQSRRDAEEPWFWDYCGGLRDSKRLQAYLREKRDNFTLARFDPRDKVILDAGSGFGIASVVMRLMGAREVYAVEALESRAAVFERMVGLLPELGGLYSDRGDVLNLSYPNGRFDFIVSNEAFSHYAEPGRFLSEAYRVLKPGGILFISDHNNGSNPRTRRETHLIWDRFENGPPGMLEKHEVTEPYRTVRARLIRATAPHLTTTEVETIAARTFGQSRDQIIRTIAEYGENKTLPPETRTFGKPPVDPITGQYIERLIDPRELQASLTKLGFRTRIFAYIGGARGNPLIRYANVLIEQLSPLSWPIGRTLKVVARKPSEG
jgi:SAM-dependent methyltransferase